MQALSADEAPHNGPTLRPHFCNRLTRQRNTSACLVCTLPFYPGRVLHYVLSRPNVHTVTSRSLLKSVMQTRAVGSGIPRAPALYLFAPPPPPLHTILHTYIHTNTHPPCTEAHAAQMGIYIGISLNSVKLPERDSSRLPPSVRYESLQWTAGEMSAAPLGTYS